MTQLKAAPVWEPPKAPRKPVPVVTYAITVICVWFTFRLYYLVFKALKKGIDPKTLKIGFIPYEILHGDLMSWVTALFYHLGFGHLFGNMVAFLIFGRGLERDL